MGYSIVHFFSYGNVSQEKFRGLRKMVSSSKALLRKLLYRMHLLQLSKIFFQKMHYLMKDSQLELSSLLKNAAEYIEQNKSYFLTNDSKEALAHKCKGDNILVIARKKE